MSVTKKCPECLVPLRAGATSCACGWKSIPAPSTTRGKGGAEVDPEPWRCASEILGQRCPDAGPFKRGDRYFCALHAGKKSLAETIANGNGREMIAKAKQVIANAKTFQRVGHVRPIAEELKPYQDVVADREFERAESIEDHWPAGRE